MERPRSVERAAAGSRVERAVRPQVVHTGGKVVDGIAGAAAKVVDNPVGDDRRAP